jgi:hypothetical protein
VRDQRTDGGVEEGRQAGLVVGFEQGRVKGQLVLGDDATVHADPPQHPQRALEVAYKRRDFRGSRHRT